MITTNSIGYFGKLGNQMFQYACLYGVAQKNGYSYGIPLEKNKEWKKSGWYDSKLYLNDIFNITAEDSSDREPKYRCYYDSLIFNDQLFSIPDDTDIGGYFQSEKYFKHCSDEIRKEFSFKNKDKYELFHKELSSFGVKIGMHIRRGDYVKLSNVYGHCSIEEYYRASVKELKTRVKDITSIIVFSDDIEWCKKNIGGVFEDISVVYDQEPKSEKEYYSNQENSLMKMSLCDHFITANSSYSWWGSWLISNQDKLIVSPKNWFIDRNYNDFKDIYQDNSILI